MARVGIGSVRWKRRANGAGIRPAQAGRADDVKDGGVKSIECRWSAVSEQQVK